jgi:hypothetical protein
VLGCRRHRRHYYYYYYYHHHHHHHHVAIMELDQLVSHSCLTHPEVSLMAFSGSFRLLVCSFIFRKIKIVLRNENYPQILSDKLHNCDILAAVWLQIQAF